MLSKHVRDMFLHDLRAKQQQLADPLILPYVHHLEARYTLFQLEELLLGAHADIERKLKDFLRERWTQLKSSDAQYLHDFTNPANLMCITIAKHLEAFYRRSYLTILMPSLTSVEVTDYISSSYTDDLQLQDLILCDRDERLIHLPDVLDFAQDDALLKHNSLFSGLRQSLSPTERERFLSRHVAVKDAYEALVARMTYKYYGPTAGAALTRLIQGMRDGGKNKNGQKYEYNTGSDANVAIAEFSIYLDTLDKVTKKKLMKAHKVDRYRRAQPEKISIEKVWAELTNPNQATLQTETRSCTDLNANKLEEILKDNPSLYDLHSSIDEVMVGIKRLDTTVSQTKEAMSQALATLEKHPSYGQKGDKRLFHKLLFNIQDNIPLRSLTRRSSPTPEFFKKPRYASEDLEAFDKSEAHQPRLFAFQERDILYFIQQYTRLTDRQLKDALAQILIYITQHYPATDISKAISECDNDESRAFMKLTGFKREDTYRSAPSFLKSKPVSQKRSGDEDIQIDTDHKKACVMTV